MKFTYISYVGLVARTLCRIDHGDSAGAFSHWRCENCTHWTADAELMEDRRRPAWSRHPMGSLAVSVLRMMVLCILSMARKLSRFGYTEETPSWGQVVEHFLLELCGSILETKAPGEV